ncbi:unnamed protein product [Parascedosporium putredinis]|uniref:Uncharacterized protein n=1 Tax=Parascedosporium putredinis TaxID=1442378 RepID=A0A9P1MDR4_9PEZI|nr:unnamed protein product [Parascedosporium putredinis]CAI8004177.1 unnamed protein product [Parascedosporium putredinis]
MSSVRVYQAPLYSILCFLSTSLALVRVMSFEAAAGVVGVIGLTIQLIQVTSKFGSDWKDAPADARSFIAELQALKTVLYETSTNITYSKDFEGAFLGHRSAVQSQIRQLATDTDTMTMVSACKAELQSLHGDLTKRANSHRMGWERLKGAFQAPRTREAVERLHRQCQTLNQLMVIDVLTLTANTYRKVEHVSERQESIHQTQNLSLDQIQGRMDDKVATRERQHILDWLTPVDYTTQHNDFIGRREDGTGEWLLESEEFTEWLNAEKKTLFCPGIPGAGKTILTSIVVEYLYTQFEKDECTGIAYIYCNFRRKDDQNIEGLLASLVKQLAELRYPFPNPVKSLYEDHKQRKTRPSVLELSKTLRAYDDAMERINGQLSDQALLAKQVIQWITCARRPLTTEELQHALAVEPGESELDEENLTETEEMISKWFPAAEEDIAMTCITYLSFNTFESGASPGDREFEERLRVNKLYEYAGKGWGHHVRQVLDRPQEKGIPSSKGIPYLRVRN